MVPKSTLIYLTSSNNNAAVYWTKDIAEADSIPEDEAHLYREAIEITEDVIIYAKAVKEGYKTSSVVELAFKLADTAQDWGDVTAADRDGFENADQIPVGIWAAGYGDVDYTGDAVSFEDLHIYSHKTMLAVNEDYTLKYANNTKAGEATATIRDHAHTATNSRRTQRTESGPDTPGRHRQKGGGLLCGTN